MQDFRKLRVWSEARATAAACYSVTAQFPSAERYGLSQQMRRASVSIASNIAEGSGRRTDRELVRYLRISYGSACELETQALVALDANLAPDGAVRDLIQRAETLRRMLHGLISAIEKSTSTTSTGGRWAVGGRR